MSGFIRDSWNYLRLGYTMYRCYGDWRERENFSNGNIESLIKRIHKCGSVAIKFVQWIKPLLELIVIDEREFYEAETEIPWWLRKLDVFYEECHEHSVDYTIREYSNAFNESLTDSHDIIDVLGSGSIGQVYLIRHKGTRTQSVLKIIHPHVISQINTFERWYRFFRFIPPIDRMLKRFPINLTDFIASFRKQCDLIQETNNLLRLRNIYQTNDFLHIPEIYKTSPGIIVMEYVKGEPFEESAISQYEKFKLFSHLYMFMRNNIICENFNHGDLHKGNWKVYEKGIVVYDFGFCWSLPQSKIHLVDKCICVFEGSIDSNRLKTIADITEIMFTIVLHPHISDKQTLRDQMHEHVSASRFVGASKMGLIVQPVSIIKLLFEFCQGRNLQIDHNLVQFLIIFIELQKHGIRYGFASNSHDPYPNVKVFKERYAKCLNFCETYDVYPKYREYMKCKLSELQVCRDSIFDTVDFPEEIRELALKKI
jgi:tRNA A-37 threonylcarbamoyl transferase component Bud32